MRLLPTQTGLLLLAAADGKGFTTAAIVAVAEQLLLVTVTVYVPLAAVAALVIVGFCSVEVKPFGPAHKYKAPPPEVRLRELPTQTGLLLPAMAVGFGFTIAALVATVVQPLAPVTAIV